MREGEWQRRRRSWLWPAIIIILSELVMTGCRTPPAKSAPPPPSSEDPDRLPIGRSPRKGELIKVRPGEIVETASMARLGFAELVERLGSVEIAYIGESHTHREHHAIQARVLAALAARPGEGWALGLEMFPRAQQPILDRWVAGELEEREFVKAVDWYRVWGFDWRYYRDLLLIARDQRLPVIALNADPKLVRRVGRGGLAALSPAERAALPPMDLSWTEHQRLVRALLGLAPPRAARSSARSHHPADPHAGLFDNLYQAQVIWDVSMAERARSFLEGGRGRRLLVIAGSGHLLYGLGINGRLAAWRPDLRAATLICQSAPERRSAEGQLVSAGLGDLIWGTAPDGKAVQYPTLGVMLREGSLEVSGLSPHGPAGRLLRKGDVLLALDGKPLADAFDLRWGMQEKTWGSTVQLKVRRGQKEIEVRFRFPLPAQKR